jgi:N-acyl-phosphatidylethanolamine-hydrolysing phospholipase D
MSLPPHHRAEGGFRNPWPGPQQGFRDFLRWRIDRCKSPLPSDPERRSFKRETPAFTAPRAAADRCSVTWVGHSTMLVQLGALNILTDPIWSTYAAPVPGLGPRRWVPAAVEFGTLPPIDIVLLSHNHYDHLDDRTVRRLANAQPDAHWVAPLGLKRFLRARGVARITELDWWQEADVAGTRVICTPAQHFSARGLFDRNRTLWASFVVRASAGSLYFGGDSGYHPDFATIGDRCGPFDISLIPIGAYEPRWMMQVVHMDPEEAVQAFKDLNARRANGHRSVMAGMHWGTFKLTDEALDEPPKRAAAAWAAGGEKSEDLWILPHGGTRWR